jgi:DNA-binding NarL/FixJ family response regulator
MEPALAGQMETIMIAITIVEDQKTIREGLSLLIDATDGLECIAAYECCEDMLKRLKADKPDVILMDIGLPGMSGIEGIKHVKKTDPDCLILVLSVYDDNEHIFEALCSGACGYLIKKTPPAQLIEAIKETHAGGSPMNSHIARKVVTFFQKHGMPAARSEIAVTEREKEILASLAQGNSYKLVADALFISIDTVRFHIRNIYRKLQVHTQSEAVATAIRKGWI